MIRKGSAVSDPLVIGDIEISDDLTVADDALITGDLTVSGATVLSGTVDLRGTLSDSTGNVTIGDAVDVSGVITSTVGSGSNAVALTTGARVDLGGGASDYLYSDGTDVHVASNLKVDGFLAYVDYVEAKTANTTLELRGSEVNDSAASDVSVRLNTAGAWDAGEIAQFSNNGTAKLNVHYDGSLIPGADITASLGSQTKRFSQVYTQTLTNNDGTGIFVADNNGTTVRAKGTGVVPVFVLSSTQSVTQGDIFYIANNGAPMLEITYKGVFVRPTGAAGVSGTATLSSGTVTVNTTAVAAGSKILLTHQGTGTVGNIGVLYVANIVAGTSFDIKSTNGSDNDSVYWVIEAA